MASMNLHDVPEETMTLLKEAMPWNYRKYDEFTEWFTLHTDDVSITLFKEDSYSRQRRLAKQD